MHDEPLDKELVQFPTAPLAGGDDASQGDGNVNTYADPLLDPLSSSKYAPITIVSPSIDTLKPNLSSAAPSFAVLSLIHISEPTRPY